ncbi:hypothetical protein GA0061078_0141 [Bifidobacterium bohemicum]|uniref:Integral membrane protein n=1 Tax=Bifidobacterium bohemicum DSM 22767 TaxID=1437606 RepID=A0A086ZG59_9BIFI|nr:Bax inhibitor-1/YccA family protein [Bifidobacterium bohemicum]KFI45509.1 Integral membrane protein [Bifidobacterium bohemicum DSM 22767]SCB71713.1 hypothetical protein GA0061078_0141 [Bifidobacterium bohemicum]
MAFGNNTNGDGTPQMPYGDINIQNQKSMNPVQPYGQPQNQPYGQPQNTYYTQPQTQQYPAPQGQPYAGTRYTPGMNRSGATPTATMNANTAYTFERARHISVAKAYGEMTLGLLLTAVVAIVSASSGALPKFVEATGTVGWIGLAIVQFAIAIVLGARIQKLKTSTARILFYAYAALTGFTLASIFFAYTLQSIGVALIMTVAFFFVLTMFALTTKLDMLKAGPILMVALLTLVIGEVVMMFIAPSNTMLMVTAGIGLIIFAGLTMYDAQQTRALYAQAAYSFNGDTTVLDKISILCSLNLYLDFVNMFLYLLQLFGSSDD